MVTMLRDLMWALWGDRSVVHVSAQLCEAAPEQALQELVRRCAHELRREEAKGPALRRYNRRRTLRLDVPNLEARWIALEKLHQVLSGLKVQRPTDPGANQDILRRSGFLHPTLRRECERRGICSLDWYQ